MGFLDYAWSVSLQEDKVKTRIRMDPKLQQPTLSQSKTGFNITLPMPSVSEDETVSFLGYEFPADSGKAKVGRLFRACVFHLTTHTLIPIDYKNNVLSSSERTLLEVFSEALVNDTYVNAYISAKHPDKLADLAFANSLAFAKMKPAERIFNPATRIMAALLSKINIGIVKGMLRPEEEDAVDQSVAKLSSLKQKLMTSMAGKETEINEVFNETKSDVIQILELNSPILEAPSLQHTEKIGPCTIFSKYEMPYEFEIEKVLKKSLKTLSGENPSKEPTELYWGKKMDVEASQAFDSWVHERARERKILTRIEKYTEGSRFKSIGFPEEDYTQYQRARFLLRGGSRRLLDSLRVAQDALDEDPRKEMGQLDMTEVIQKIASRSPRTDVFKQNEYLSRSFAWGILFDVSASMKVRGELSRALAICVAEATKELLMDPGSWTFYAFSDRFYILKDTSEAYSRRVRARIGGLKFDGLTYMPDAIRVAGKILAQRFDEQRFLIVLSDGWPYGYPNMPSVLAESIHSLEKKGVIVIGVGLESERIRDFFKISSVVYNQKDLIKKFAKIYAEASAAALES
jgi:hypothetical protein